jgi:hypothetical protein
MNIGRTKPAIFLTTLLLAACAGTPNRQVEAPTSPDRARQIPKHTSGGGAAYAAAEQNAQHFTEIEFRKGSSALSRDATYKLDTAMRKARRLGEIDQIKIISWSDQEYPAENSRELPDRQLDLADRRSESIENYLEDKLDWTVDIDEHNMADRPNDLERIFETSDYRVKQSLEQAGAGRQGGRLTLGDKSQRALVLFLLDPKEDNRATAIDD